MIEYELNGTLVRIPEAEVEALKTKWGLTNQEAINLWLEDNDKLITDEYQKELDKTKGLRIQTGAESREKEERKLKGEKKKIQRKPRVDNVKKAIISNIAEKLAEMGEITVENDEKIVILNINGEEYKLNLTKTRKKA